MLVSLSNDYVTSGRRVNMINSIINFGKIYSNSTQKEVKVETTTIDSYCQQYNIESIDILKIDVQGNELKVLQGAKRMLKETRVKLIFTEISIAPNYKEQSEIDEIIKLLRENEYKIFNFFKMKHKEGKLIECDVLFYAEKLFF